MNFFTMFRAALVLAAYFITAQSASALSCTDDYGDAGGDTAAQIFANAATDSCSIVIGAGNGHYLQNWSVGVGVLFFENGSQFTPDSRSLSCTGATGTTDSGDSLGASFPSTIYSTTCDLSYTDANGQTVSHSFDASTINFAGAIIGYIAPFSVTTGWFERVSPTVAISGLPAEVNGTTPVTANITFSENVTGFTANEVSVSGGSVSGLSGIGANYVATIVPTGQSDVVVSVAAAVAQDLAGNDNTASASATATNATASETGELIAQFMLGRANALLANQPDLAGFLRGGAGHFNAEVSRDGGGVSFNSGYDAPIWARLNANWSTNAGAESTYIFGVVGGHSKLSTNLLIGGMLQFDVQDETSGTATISGKGWLVGPYFAAKLPDQPLYFEGSFLYGQTSNEISPQGTYTDSFTTERWLATLGVSGLIEKDNYTLAPFLDAKYTSDAHNAYTDGLNNPIAAQTVSLGQVSAGLDVALPLGGVTTVNAGLSGIWSFSSGSLQAPGFEGGRARVDMGVAHQLNSGGNLNLSSFYDGLGAQDFESYGIEIAWQHKF